MNNDIKKRKRLYSLLGDLPDIKTNLECKQLFIEKKDNYLIERLVFDINNIKKVPAIFIKPQKHSKKKLPCIIYCHSHGGNYSLGKNELIYGCEHLGAGPYAPMLTDIGFSILCIDSLLFGERRGKTESEAFKEMLWKGQTLFGVMVFDVIKSIDYLFTRDDVDCKKIGTLGMSMGSTLSWWSSALDTRISFCGDICCMTDFEELINAGGLDLHGIYYYVPSILKHFSTADINKLIAPRPHFCTAGEYDKLTPYRGLLKIDSELKKYYNQFNCPENWNMKIYPTGHFETFQMRKDMIDFLKKFV